jgi:hypothetical protein
VSFWFYRDQTTREVDFVWEKGGLLSCAECKWKEKPDKNDINTIMALDGELMKNQGLTQGGRHFLICNAANSFSMNEKVTVVNLDSLAVLVEG